MNTNPTEISSKAADGAHPPRPEASGCDCKDCNPDDAALALQLSLARTDAARERPTFTPGAAGNEVTIYARDYDIIRAALAQQPAAVDGENARRWKELCRQIDAGEFPASIIDDAMNMGSGALELHVDAALAAQQGGRDDG